MLRPVQRMEYFRAWGKKNFDRLTCVVQRGLTGGGGAIFAVPLLIYGLGLSAKDAIGVSLVTVAVTACFGFVQRARVHQVDFSTGIVL